MRNFKHQLSRRNSGLQCPTVSAISRNDEICRAKRRARADRNRFLAGAKMNGACGDGGYGSA